MNNNQQQNTPDPCTTLGNLRVSVEEIGTYINQPKSQASGRLRINPFTADWTQIEHGNNINQAKIPSSPLSRWARIKGAVAAAFRKVFGN